MGKALMGAYATPRTVQLLDEVRVLRQRVADLERALADAEAIRDARTTAPDDARMLADDELVTLDEAAVVSR